MKDKSFRIDKKEKCDENLTNREQYDKDMYDEKRRRGELAAAKEDGKAEGLAQGQVEMARKFKVLGVDIDTIVQASGLDRDTVEGL